MTADTPAPVCRECWENFDIEWSPDLDRCPPCAERQAWHNGALLITGQPRIGNGAGVVAPMDLIVSAPVWREQKEG